MSEFVHTWAASPLVHRVCWALLHSLWEGAIVSALLAMTKWSMRGCSASVRHSVACLALLLLAACPIITFVQMDREPPVLERSIKVTASAVPAIILARTPASVAESQPLPPSESFASFTRTVRLRSHLRWEFWVVSGWLAGLGVLTLWHAIGWVLMQRLRQVGVSPLSPAMEALVAKARGLLRLKKPVVVRWSSRLSSPVVLGWLRPVILLPLSLASGLSAREWELILLHEMAHLRRHDYLINLAQIAVETLLFYHPATWWISRQIRREREHACDDAAAELSHDSAGYARALTKMAEAQLELPHFALGVGGPRGELYHRIIRLLSPAPQSFALRPMLGGVATALLICCTVFVATTHPTLAQNKGKPLPGSDEPVRGDIRDRNGVVLATSDRLDHQILFKVEDIVQAWTAAHGEKLPTYQYPYKEKGEAREMARVDYARVLDEVAAPLLKTHGLAQALNMESIRADAEPVHRDKANKINPTGFTLFYRRWLSEEEFKRAESIKASVPGMITRIVKFRRYPLQATAAHVLGYVGYDKRGDAVNKGLDTAKGRSGAESAWDAKLKAKGQTGPPIKRGDDIYLTLDARHQTTVEQTLRDAGVGRGAAVLVDTASSDVLAMASVPSFDPNDFVPAISKEGFEALLNDKALPMLNRAAAGGYAPGSAFLPVTSLAAVCAGHENDTYNCEGMLSLNNRDYKCWIGMSGGGHGAMTLSEGIEHSCNVFFYRLGIATGMDQMETIGRFLGLGRKTGTGLYEEKDGTMPGPKWIAQIALSEQNPRVTKDRWTDGHTANTAIGQGYVLVSPLQMAGVMNTIANDGVVRRPRLLDKTVSSSDQATLVEPRIQQADLHEHGLTVSGLNIIRKGLYDAVHGGKGSSSKAESEQISIAGHTGTAQFWRGPERTSDNRSWFVCYAPADKPRWALSILIEGGKSGGAVAAPIARRILEQVAAIESGQLKVEIKPMPPLKGHFDAIESVRFADGEE